MSLTRCNNKVKFSNLVLATEVQTHVGPGVFVAGAGGTQDDCTVTVPSGVRAKIDEDFDLVIEIDAEDTTDTCKISLDGGDTWWAEGVACSSSALATAIPGGLYAVFAATTGHDLGDQWTFPVYAFKAHAEQDLSDGYARWMQAALPSFPATAVDTQENMNTGSKHPKDVDISGITLDVPVELDKASFEDLRNALVWTLGKTDDLVTEVADELITPVYTVYEAACRSVGFRVAKEMSYHRLYGMAPRSLNITLPTMPGGFMRLSMPLLGIGKHDDNPGAPSEVAGTLGDTSITLPTTVANLSIRNVRQVWAKTAAGAIYSVHATRVSGTTLYIDAPVSGSDTACTYYVSYLSNRVTTSGTWEYNVENATELTPKFTKSTHLQLFMVGGTVSGSEALETVDITGGKRLRCDIEGDIQINIDPEAQIKICSDGVNDNAANMILIEGGRATISFSQQIYDMLYQYLAENPDHALAGMPIKVVYGRPDGATMTVLFPLTKLTSGEVIEINGRTGCSLAPVVLDDGTYSPFIFMFTAPTA